VKNQEKFDSMADFQKALQTADWRRRVIAIYSEVRRQSQTDPRVAHEYWRRERDILFATHPASPLLPEDHSCFTHLPIAPYNSAFRFELPIIADREPCRLQIQTGTDGVVPFDRIGSVHVPDIGDLDVWYLGSYGGGIFVPIKDNLAGKPDGTYGGGRYLIDTIKGADLGPNTLEQTLVLDFNFAYNPSCAYNPVWACPLAPAGNVVPVDIPVGERYSN
jgi:uncharacterized protein (DUF1684 family)